MKLFKFQLRFDKRGQNLIEWALLIGLLAMAAGAIMPGVADSISTVFSNVTSVLSRATSPDANPSSASPVGFAANPRARD